MTLATVSREEPSARPHCRSVAKVMEIRRQRNPHAFLVQCTVPRIYDKAKKTMIRQFPTMPYNFYEGVFRALYHCLATGKCTF